MSHALSASLVANALQKLEALQNNESEVLNDETCRKRAEEVAEVALKSVAVCVKYLLAQNGEARIEGLGDFYLADNAIEFASESDTLQYALLKQQPPEKHQLALRNAFVKGLVGLRKLIPLLVLETGMETTTEESGGTAEEKLLRAIFGETVPNKFDRTISLVLTAMIKDLRDAGVNLLLSEVEAQPGVESGQKEDQSDLAPGTASAEVGKTYLGKVSRLADFGAFVEIIPGTEGLLHISEVAEHRIKDIHDELKEGDQVLVKALSVEGNRIKLSRKAILKAQRGKVGLKAEAEPKTDAP